jgi:2Fe-2S ferredoxin
MPTIMFVASDGTRRVVDALVGQSLLEVAHCHKIGLEGVCEGKLSCSTCHVIVAPGWFDRLPAATEEEEDMLDLASGLCRTSRLACQIIIGSEMNGLEVILPPAARNMMVAGAR